MHPKQHFTVPYKAMHPKQHFTVPYKAMHPNQHFKVPYKAMHPKQHFTVPYKAMHPKQHFTIFFLTFIFNLLAKRFFFLKKTSFVIAVMDLISQEYLAAFVTLSTYLKYSTLSRYFKTIVICIGVGCLDVLTN
jgi:hypothetical protein